MTTPPVDQRFEDRLRQVVPSSAFVGDVREYAVDGRTPALVVAPASAQEVASVLEAASEASAAVMPWGGGSHMHLGMPPGRYDMAMDLARLDRLVEHEPADLTVTVEAGMPFAVLQRRLQERGQWLPLDPPFSSATTIGGVLASNASGPARVAHLTARDLVIGMSVVTARGEMVKSGGRVVKNVAGYDMAKLHIGALGTLGVISQVTFKVAPLPPATTSLELTAPGPEQLYRLSVELLDRGLAINGLALTNGKDVWRLLVRLAGSAAGVERSEQEFRTLASAGAAREATADDWEDVGALGRPDAPEAVVLRTGVLPTRSLALLEAMASAGGQVLAYPTVGLLFGRWSRPSSDIDQTILKLREQARASGGSVVVEAAPADLKTRVGVWGPPRADFEIMRRLKAELDPANILNPGRYLGGL